MLDSCCQDTKETMIWINNNIDNLYQIYKHSELGNNEVADIAHIFFITKKFIGNDSWSTLQSLWTYI